jgi:hypothetical protein
MHVSECTLGALGRWRNFCQFQHSAADGVMQLMFLFVNLDPESWIILVPLAKLLGGSHSKSRRTSRGLPSGTGDTSDTDVDLTLSKQPAKNHT